MNALEQLLETTTYDEVRIEDVMASAGLTRTAFYRYFPDMEELLLAWLEIIRAEFEVEAYRWLDVGVDPDSSILAATTGLAAVWSRHHFVLKAILDAATSGTRMQHAWRAQVEAFFAPVETRLADLAVHGRLPVAHPEQTARALVWMCERYLAETFTQGHEVSVETAGVVLADIFRRVALGAP